jgi:hypothetical protein
MYGNPLSRLGGFALSLAEVIVNQSGRGGDFSHAVLLSELNHAFYPTSAELALPLSGLTRIFHEFA